MQKAIKQPKTRWENNRAYSTRTQKFHEIVQKVIRFTRRSAEELRATIVKLLVRYKKVEVHSKLVAGMLQGYLTVTLK